MQLGSDSFQLDFTDPATDLADVRDAINNATDNPGIRASLIQVDGGSVLSLSSDRIGADSALSFGGTGDFSAFAADISPTQPGEDAQIRIDGMLRTASSNSISDAIEGVTLNLLQADIGQSTTLTVARDDSPLTEALEGFVTAWNAFASRADTLGEYNPVTGNGGPLNGNALLRGIETRLRAVVGQGAGPDGNLLGAEFGLSFDNSGKLELDSTRLNTALTDRRADVAAWWSGADGLVAKLDTALEGLLDEDASLRSREIALEAQLDRIADREEKLDIRMERVEARYLKQFTALDVALAQLQSTSSYLASQLGSLLGSQQNN
ncbi:MAG: flagellar filament capping protein FliD [Oceanococcaceae bacterium]